MRKSRSRYHPLSFETRPIIPPCAPSNLPKNCFFYALPDPILKGLFPPLHRLARVHSHSASINRPAAPLQCHILQCRDTCVRTLYSTRTHARHSHIATKHWVGKSRGNRRRDRPNPKKSRLEIIRGKEKEPIFSFVAVCTVYSVVRSCVIFCELASLQYDLLARGRLQHVWYLPYCIQYVRSNLIFDCGAGKGTMAIQSRY